LALFVSAPKNNVTIGKPKTVAIRSRQLRDALWQCTQCIQRILKCLRNRALSSFPLCVLLKFYPTTFRAYGTTVSVYVFAAFAVAGIPLLFNVPLIFSWNVYVPDAFGLPPTNPALALTP
jgi:hypothetical protein